jgi:hypothetical protein
VTPARTDDPEHPPRTARAGAADQPESVLADAGYSRNATRRRPRRGELVAGETSSRGTVFRVTFDDVLEQVRAWLGTEITLVLWLNEFGPADGWLVDTGGPLARLDDPDPDIHQPALRPLRERARVRPRAHLVQVGAVEVGSR